ncbi:ATP-binding protein [Streptomyces sp. NPDC088768]|uniref:ATP-binding protein n=1 Tax=Streptomyces sp. NPDC088768 TaxID=3365894 RepID=UPI003809DA28
MPLLWAAHRDALGQDIVSGAQRDAHAAGMAKAVADAEAVRSRDEQHLAETQEALREAREWNAELGRLLEAMRRGAEVGRQHVRFALESVKDGRPAPLFNMPTLAGEEEQTGRTVAVMTALQALVNEARAAVFEVAGAVESRMQSHVQELAGQSDAGALMGSLAPRLHALIVRATVGIDQASLRVDDPFLQHDLWSIEHLLVRLRREIERMQFLAGHSPGRNEPPTQIAGVLRRAVSECADYPRVKLTAPPFQVAVHGWVSPVIVHALSTLVDNATAVTSKQVHITARQRGDAVVLEVLDQGPGVAPETAPVVQELLARPEAASVRAFVRKGSIGLLVAAQLAAPHGIRLALKPREDGVGTRGLVIVPASCLTAQPAAPAPVGLTPIPRLSSPARSAVSSPSSLPPDHDATDATLTFAGRRPLPRRPTTNTAPSEQPHQARPPQAVTPALTDSLYGARTPRHPDTQE